MLANFLTENNNEPFLNSASDVMTQSFTNYVERDIIHSGYQALYAITYLREQSDVPTFYSTFLQNSNICETRSRFIRPPSHLVSKPMRRRLNPVKYTSDVMKRLLFLILCNTLEMNHEPQPESIYFFFSFGATAPIWALAYLHETPRFA
jgi:hypothetical protein